MTKRKEHPLNGTFAYFDSQLEIKVGRESTYELDGRKYQGRLTFEGRYSVELEPGLRYYWPVVGGTINPLQLEPGAREKDTTMWEIAFVLFSPQVSKEDPTYGNTALSRFVDAWAGYAGLESRTRRVEVIELRYVNVTFDPGEGTRAAKASPMRRGTVPTVWSAFSWQPTWNDYGARSYIRIG